MPEGNPGFHVLHGSEPNYDVNRIPRAARAQRPPAPRRSGPSVNQLDFRYAYPPSYSPFHWDDQVRFSASDQTYFSEGRESARAFLARRLFSDFDSDQLDVGDLVDNYARHNDWRDSSLDIDIRQALHDDEMDANWWRENDIYDDRPRPAPDSQPTSTQQEIFSSRSGTEFDQPEAIRYPSGDEYDDYLHSKRYRPSYNISDPDLDNRRVASAYIPDKNAAFSVDFYDPSADLERAAKQIPKEVRRRIDNLKPDLQGNKRKIGNVYDAAQRTLSSAFGLDTPVVYPPKNVDIDVDALSYLTNYDSSTGNIPKLGIHVSPIRKTDEFTSLAFQGPADYASSKDLKKELLQPLYTPEQRKQLTAALDKMKHPMYQPLLSYALGDQINNVPIGGHLTQTPLGGEGGQRDKLYSRQTRGVLKSVDGRSVAKRDSPTTWTRRPDSTEIEWDPNDLKERALFRVFNPLDDQAKETIRGFKQDHSLIPVAQGGNPNLNPVVYGSPKHRMLTGRGAGLIHGAATNLFPSSETVRKFYQESPKAALENMGVEQALSIPTSAAIGAGVAAVPAVAPFMPGVGLGLGLTEAGRTVDAISRQQYGEGALDKVQQFLGTRNRTGISSDENLHKAVASYRNDRKNFGADKALESYLESTEPAPQTIQAPTRNQWVDPLPRRIRMAADRFNPARGEFGLSELLFGR
tara:strand:- start:88 stop:2160 length:2073 start_codon:yes stop_codon:yes gene_type:complete